MEERKGEGGEERRCAVGIFNYFRLCSEMLSPATRRHSLKQRRVRFSLETSAAAIDYSTSRLVVDYLVDKST